MDCAIESFIGDGLASLVVSGFFAAISKPLRVMISFRLADGFEDESRPRQPGLARRLSASPCRHPRRSRSDCRGAMSSKPRAHAAVDVLIPLAPLALTDHADRPGSARMPRSGFVGSLLSFRQASFIAF